MLSNLEIIGWTKFRGQPKLDEAVGRVQFGCQRNFLNSIISKLDKHEVLLLINYIAGYLIQIFSVSQTRNIVHSNRLSARSQKCLFLRCHLTYPLQIKKRRSSIALSYFGILLPLWKLLLNDLNDTVLHVKNPAKFRVQRRQSNNANS